jgi:hypothetical protein
MREDTWRIAQLYLLTFMIASKRNYIDANNTTQNVILQTRDKPMREGTWRLAQLYLFTFVTGSKQNYIDANNTVQNVT